MSNSKFIFKNKVDGTRIKNINKEQEDLMSKLGIKTFLINMEISKDRYKKVIEELNKHNIKNINKLNAFNGNYEIEEMKKELSEFPIHNSEKLKEFENYLKENNYDEIKVGHQGCASSHLYIYKYIVQNQIPFSLIIEDDVCLHPNFNKLFLEAWNNRPKNGILFNFISSYAEINNDCKNYLSPTWKEKAGQVAAFYIITNEAAEKILLENTKFPILLAADDVLYKNLINSYKLHYNNDNIFEQYKMCGTRKCGIVSTDDAENNNSVIKIVNEKKNEMYKNYYNNMRKYDVFGHILSIELIEEIRNLLEEIIDIFSKNNIKPILLFGTLLGYARTGKNMLQWDDDIDLGIPREEEEFVYNIINRSKNLKCIKHESDGFLPDKYLYKICLKNKENFHGRNYSYPFIDIFGYITVEKNDPILLREKVFDEDSPVIFLKPLQLIKTEFFNIKNGIYVPENYEFYLDKWFSSDWRNTCISNNWNHIDEKKINNYEKVKCQNLIPFFENNKNRDLFENTVIIDYNENGVTFLKSQLNYYNIIPKIILGDKTNMNTSHIQVIETFFKDSKNKDKYLTILEENVNLTGFFPNNLPENWDIISLNNCYDNSHCCSSINTDNKNFIEMENNIIRYKKIPSNLLISYIINLKGYEKLKKYGFNNLKLYDIFGYNPNVTKECFKSVDRYENSILPKNKYTNKITSTIVILLIMTIIIILIILIFLRKNNLKFKKTI